MGYDYIYYVSQGTYTGYWRWEVSEWVETQPMNSTLATVNVTADRALANVELLAKYTSSVDEIAEVVEYKRDKPHGTHNLFTMLPLPINSINITWNIMGR